MTGFVTEMVGDMDGVAVNSRYIIQLEYPVPSRPKQKRIEVECKNLREHDSLVTDYGLGGLRFLLSMSDLPRPDKTRHHTTLCMNRSCAKEKYGPANW